MVVLELCDGMALAWPTRPTSGDGQLQDAIIRFGGISYSVIDDQEKHAERSEKVDGRIVSAEAAAGRGSESCAGVRGAHAYAHRQW